MLIYAAIIFVLVTIVSITLLAVFFPSKPRQRLQALMQSGDKTNWVKKAAGIASPLAKLSAPQGAWEQSPLRVKFINAGIRSANAPTFFYAAKTLLPAIFGVIGYLVLRILDSALDSSILALYLLVIAIVGCYFPNILLARAIKARKREIFENFPDAADLILVCVEAGLGLDAALVKVAEEMRITSPALAEEIHLTSLETRVGGTRAQALRNLGLRTGVEEIHTFVSILAQTDKFGTNIGDALRVFSDDLRHKRQMRAEELAAKLPTKMLFPLVLCIFPAISMVILGPAGVQIYRVILPMLAGQH